MEVLEIRPARVSAALVAIGDMLVSSPIGENGPRPSRWIGAVTEHVIVEEEPSGRKVDDPAAWRKWRVGRVDGTSVETAVIPADGWVWVHLPIVDGPVGPAPIGGAITSGLEKRAAELDGPLSLVEPIPSEAGPARDAWLAARGWASYEEWASR
jgi:hypothetical protein